MVRVGHSLALTKPPFTMAPPRFSKIDQNAPRDEDERGVAEVSEKLYTRVTRYHATIGTEVPKETLGQLEWNLLNDAKEQFHRGEYEQALNTFTATLAVTEKTRSSKDYAVRGAIVHNIASCLHHLGEIEAAQEYYEQAINSFEKAKTGVVEKMLYGDTNKRRVDFVKERLIDISWGRKPDVDKYLDELGRKKVVPQPPVNGGQTKLSSQWDEDMPPPPWAQRDMLGQPNRELPGWMNAAGAAAAGTSQPQRPVVYDAAPVGARDDEVAAPPHATNDDGSSGSSDLDDDAQEESRRQWLQYYLQTAEWDKADELVVTREEREDLEYLRDREERVAKEGSLIDVGGNDVL